MLKNFFSSLLQLRDQDVRCEGYGTFMGIFIPNTTMMFGVILFLRMALVTGTIGLEWMLVIFFLSLLLMLITSWSIASIVTNLQVGGGGIYYIASRALGVEIGGAVGLAIYIAQIASAALCVTGFAYSIQELIPSLSLELIEALCFLTLVPLSVYSTRWVLKAQLTIFILLMLALVSIFAGDMPSLDAISALSNEGVFQPYFEGGLSFWAAFAMIFPAFTGIEVGMAMSGELKRPGWSIALGTPLSLLFSFSVYLILSSFAYLYIERGILSADPFFLVHYAWSSGLVFVGIWVATLSSALGSLLAAPRMLQTLSEDGITPGIFARTHGENDEPAYAIIFTGVVALLCALFTRIDQIIPILSMIALITYAVLNFLALYGSFVRPASWRPQVSAPATVSLLGVLLALLLMFNISPLWSSGGILLIAFLHFLLRRRDIEVDFQDIRESILFYASRILLRRLEKPTQHALTWHPQLLVFTAAPQNNLKCVHLAHSLTRKSGLLSFAMILTLDEMSQHFERVAEIRSFMRGFYQKLGISCFVEAATWESFEAGFEGFVKSYGIGGVQPNTIVMGWPSSDESFYRLARLSRILRQERKNLICFKSLSEDKHSIRLFTRRLLAGLAGKNIHVWWDGVDRDNFEIMLSYLSNLRATLVWSRASVTIKSVASDEGARVHIENYLTDYCQKNRLSAQVDVHLIDDFAHYYQTVNYSSKEAQLVFLGLIKVEDDQEYSDYLIQVSRAIADLDNVALVSCYDEVDHSAIYAIES